MTVIRNFGMSGVGSTLEFGKRGGTLNYDDATKVFSFTLSTALTIPSGNDAQRPTTSTLGMLRVNTQSTPVLELYNGTSWVTVGSGGGSGGVTQIVGGTNVNISSTGPSGTGIVTIDVPSIPATSLAGGDTNQIPYQSAPDTTAFSTKFTWNNSTSVLSIGALDSTATLSAPDAQSSFPAGSLIVKGGNASAFAPAGSVTISGGSGRFPSYRGGHLILQGGQGVSSPTGSGDVVLRTGAGGTLIDRLRILSSGAWSVGNNESYTGQVGEILTSQGPNSPPLWQAPSTATGITQVLAGVGIAIGQTGTVVTVSATGAGGGTPGGQSGQIQFNNAGSFSGTSQIVYSTTNTLTVGAVNSTFTITAISGSTTNAGNLLIKSGDQISGGTTTSFITIAGGNSQVSNLNGGIVYIQGGLGSGSGSSVGGSVIIRTTTNSSQVDRLIIAADGSWGINGFNYGSSGQVLTSQGPGLPPIWMAGGGGGGGSGVTSVNVSGGTTGLSTFGGPITNTGTITLTGTLSVSAGGTGLTRVPGSTGSLFFNNSNTFAEITGMKYDGSTNLYINTVNLTTEDNFTEFTQTYPITIKPGTGRINTAFSANLNLSGGDNFSTINRAGNVVISGGINSTATRSGSVILRTNNFDRFTISNTGAYGVPLPGGPNYGTPGQVLTSQGPNNPPVWQDAGGGGTGTSGVIAVTAVSPVASSGGNTPVISLGTVPASLGGTGLTNFTVGDIIYASGVTQFSKLNIGSSGQILSVVAGRPQWTASAAGVQSFSGGVTGLTPSTATTGLVTLSGRLNISAGGTGASTSTTAFNNLSPTLFRGDTIYRDTTEHRRLPIGPDGSVLTSVGGIPAWAPVYSLPGFTGNDYKFLTNNGSTASWSNLITYTDNGTAGDDITIRGEDGNSPGTAAGDVNIIGGNPGTGGNSKGNINIQIGTASAAALSVSKRGDTSSLFVITNQGAVGFGGANYGTTDQVLTSRGSSQTPIWKDAPAVLPNQTGNSGKFLSTDGTNPFWETISIPQTGVTKIIAGNSNVIVSPTSGTGDVTISVVGSGFQGVTSFSAGSTGFSPQSSTTGAVVLTGTLLTTSGGTGLTSYSAGDIIYATGTNALSKLSIGPSGRVLTSNGVQPTWAVLNALPAQSTATTGLFLSSDGSAAYWNQQLQSTNTAFNLTGLDLSIGQSINIKAGSSSTLGGGGNITLQVGTDSSAGYFRVKNTTTEFFRISRFGSWSLGDSGTNTGNIGQILTSQGPNSPPEWTSAGASLPEQTGFSGYFLTTDGTSASWAVVTGGTGLPGGSNGQFQYNNNGAFAGTNQMYFTVPNTIRLGNANTFNILGSDSPDNNTLPGASLLIKGGQSGATSVNGLTAAAGDVIVQGGDGKTTSPTGAGGNVYIVAGEGPVGSGFVSILTGITATERLRFQQAGSWLVDGETGNNNQVLTSLGANNSPAWANTVNKIVAGSNITITSTNLDGTGQVTINSTATPLSTATTTTLGGVKIGTGISITQDGTISALGTITSISATTGTTVSTSTGDVIIGASTATTSTIGSIKVGNGLAIEEDGRLNVTAVISEKFELAFAATGLVDRGTIFLYTSGRTITIPANLAGTYSSALIPASDDTTMQIYKLSSSGVINNIGSILFAANATTGAYTFPSVVTLLPGDTLYMTIGVADATLSDVSLTLNAAVE